MSRQGLESGSRTPEGERGSQLLVVNGDARLAYNITRMLFEKQTELAAIHPEARHLSLATAVKGSPAPFHPGALRYYGETGAVK